MIRINYSIVFAVLLGFMLSSCESRKYPVAAVDPMEDALVVDDHSQVLVEWMKKGYRGMTLIHVDHHDDFRYVPQHKIKRLEKLAKEEKWDEILRERDVPDGLFSVADFIYPASELGIIKKVYWVTTSDLLEMGDVETGARALLRIFRYPHHVVSSFNASGRTATGVLHGREVTISTIKYLPDIAEPVLLTIDLDYFSNILKEKKAYEIDLLRSFFDNLKKKNVSVRHLSLTYSINGNYTPITDKHVGDQIMFIIRNPEVLDDVSRVPLPWIVRDYGFSLLRENRFSKSLEFFTHSLESPTFPDDAPLLLGKAVSLSFLDRDDEAFRTLKTLVKTDPSYDYAYVHLANASGKEGKVQWAKQYIQEYLLRHPDFGLRQYPVIEEGN